MNEEKPNFDRLIRAKEGTLVSLICDIRGSPEISSIRAYKMPGDPHIQEIIILNYEKYGSEELNNSKYLLLNAPSVTLIEETEREGAISNPDVLGKIIQYEIL